MKLTFTGFIWHRTVTVTNVYRMLLVTKSHHQQDKAAIDETSVGNISKVSLIIQVLYYEVSDRFVEHVCCNSRTRNVFVFNIFNHFLYVY